MLYPLVARNAAPKCISRRTSYHGLISLSTHKSSENFQHSPVRSSTEYCLSFNRSWVGHLRFGSSTCRSSSPYSDLVSLRLRSEDLKLATHTNSQTPLKRHQSQVKPAPTPCRHMVSGSISLLTGVLFTFPSRCVHYRSLTSI